ncbi:hypothetical protein D3C86_1705880 [compost metagenome]
MRAPRQGAHFIGNHRKPAPHVTGPRGFDGGVERQQVGLFGNPANHCQHLVDGCNLMGQRPDRSGGNADFVGHALNMPDRATDHFPRLHRLIPSGL